MEAAAAPPHFMNSLAGIGSSMRRPMYLIAFCGTALIAGCHRASVQRPPCRLDEGALSDSAGRFHYRANPRDSACARRDSTQRDRTAQPGTEAAEREI